MIYFDTAYMLKCYLPETGNHPVRNLLERSGSAACCAFGRVEFAAGVMRAVREGRLDRRAVSALFSVLDRDDQQGVWTWLALTPQLVETTAQSLRALPDGVFIRAGDALHIVCAREHGYAEIYTSDRHLLAAAPHFRIKAVNVIP